MDHIQVIQLISSLSVKIILFFLIQGSLSAWFRLKYPHLVYGAISASSPMTALTDFRGSFLIIVKI